ncbi:MAG: ATP-binding protein [Candidatus Marinimicrobia bacterium]|nr:ATP-binding protein [Candidatus Neomarinimicrobiota bacterium]
MNKDYISRLLSIPDYSFFLFGPRGSGKSTWLKHDFETAHYFDLLDSSLYLELMRNPTHLEALIGNESEDTWIVIDEIQKIPILLDEVHRLMTKYHWRFALCGSSARKLRRSGTNLLAGRAITLNIESFSYGEIKYNIDQALEIGLLPFVIQTPAQAQNILSAYVNTYIKEEIREEGLVRNLPPFVRFLAIAGLLNGQVVNGQNIAREAEVPRSNVDVYFSILTDTLLGHFLPSYQPNLKVRERTAPKFYWFDPGVARAAAGMIYEPVDQYSKGFALETLIFHELRVYNENFNRFRPIRYYRTAAGVEIDFVIETKRRTSHKAPHIICIEVKLASKWNRRWENAMRDLDQRQNINVDRMIGIYMGKQTYHFDGVDVYPVKVFLEKLYNEDYF